MAEEPNRQQSRLSGIDFTVKKLNGEIRARITMGMVSVSITKKVGESRGWQPAHVHLSANETYFILEGCVISAIQNVTGSVFYCIREAGAIFKVAPGDPLSLLIAQDSILVTVNQGTRKASDDWISSPELDAVLRELSPEVLAARLGRPPPFKVIL